MRSFTILTALAALATSTLASIDSNGHAARPHGRRAQRSAMRRLRRAEPVEVLKLAVAVSPGASSADAGDTSSTSAAATSSGEAATTSKRATSSITRAQASTTSTTSKSSPTPIKLSTPSYNSTAIWYATTGFVTSCNVTISNNDDIIALPEALYSNGNQVSDFCGQSVLATNPATGAQVTLKVASASWRSEYTIVTRNTFIALGGVPVEGELPISFQFVRASVAKDAVQEVKLYAISSSSAAAAAASSSRVAAAESVSASIADAAASESASLSKAAASKSVSLAASASAASSRGAAATAKADVKAKADAKAQADADEAEAHSSSVAASAAAASEAAAERATTTAPKKTTAPTPAKEEMTEKAKATPVKVVVVATTPAAATTTSASSDGGSSGGSSSGGGSGDVHTGGYATFYTQNGVAGNCGTVAQDSDYVIALPTAMYANGAHCGKKIVVTRVSDGAKVTATVRDSCPVSFHRYVEGASLPNQSLTYRLAQSCVNNECLDLSVAAFTAIATEEEGMVSITWQWAA